LSASSTVSWSASSSSLAGYLRSTACIITRTGVITTTVAEIGARSMRIFKDIKIISVEVN
jgi:3-deoxy-D-manno-octulosonic-acid transferase